MPKLAVIGVAGSGKSLVGARLAGALGCELLEGDEFHAPASREKMRNGLALDDHDREPWLARLGQRVAASPGDVVLACSALKRRYRDRLRSFVPLLRFVFLDIDVATAAQRVGERSGHLFPKSLVTSQFAALESPVGEAGVLPVSALLAPPLQVHAVLQWLAAGGELRGP